MCKQIDIDVPYTQTLINERVTTMRTAIFVKVSAVRHKIRLKPDLSGDLPALLATATYFVCRNCGLNRQKLIICQL